MDECVLHASIIRFDWSGKENVYVNLQVDSKALGFETGRFHWMVCVDLWRR